MRAYFFTQALKEALSGKLGVNIKLYTEEAKQLEVEGFIVSKTSSANRYIVSWASVINDVKGKDVSEYIYGVTDIFPEDIQKPIEKLCIISLRAIHT